MSSFFRRPGDSDSDSLSDSSSEEEASELIDRSVAPHEEGTSANAELSKTESVSSTASLSANNNSENGPSLNVDQVRNMMLATLLEDFYRSQAAQLLNDGQGGIHYDRDSPEVQPLAAKLFAEGSKALALSGLLQPSVATPDNQSTRRQYLTGLSNLSLKAIQDGGTMVGPSRGRPPSATSTQLVLRRPSHTFLELFPDAMRNILTHTNRMSISTPQSDLQLSNLVPRRSHYESSFRELCLLGKGGFGRVYHAYNLFDKKEYAVKKIALSPRMSQRYREAGHQELESVLREVQALAALEHNNVVRYHATWIEEPIAPTPAPLFNTHSINPFRPRPRPQPRLLADHPAMLPVPDRVRASFGRRSSEQSDGIVFGLDSSSGDKVQHVEPESRSWLQQASISDQISLRESEIFTDGQGHLRTGIEAPLDNSVYVLHVQMSMYPTTLAQYLAVRAATSEYGSTAPSRRHCFHLVPALRILLGILCGLQYIHARGLIHRDIKPSNIFLSDVMPAGVSLQSQEHQDVGSCHGCAAEEVLHLNPRIGDFGLVTELAQSDVFTNLRRRSGSDKITGTEYYRPPLETDQQGKRVPLAIDEKIDVFALGVVLVELLWPCSTSSERLQVLRELQRRKLPPGFADRIDRESHYSGIGRKVEECIRAMIEPQASKRYGCSEIQRRVEDMLAGCGRSVDPVVQQGYRQIGND